MSSPEQIVKEGHSLERFSLGPTHTNLYAAATMATMSAAVAAETKAPRILGTFWAFYGISVLMVSARLWTRASALKNMGLDDYIIAGAMVSNVSGSWEYPLLISSLRLCSERIPL